MANSSSFKQPFARKIQLSIFLCNGIRWPLFLCLLTQFTVLEIIFVYWAQLLEFSYQMVLNKMVAFLYKTILKVNVPHTNIFGIQKAKTILKVNYINVSYSNIFGNKRLVFGLSLQMKI